MDGDRYTSSPKAAIAIHLWGKKIGNDADRIADEAIAALFKAGYSVIPNDDWHVEYAVLHDNGNDEAWIDERSCGCEHIFGSVEDILAYYDLDVTDVVMCRTVTQWKPWKGQL